MEPVLGVPCGDVAGSWLKRNTIFTGSNYTASGTASASSWTLTVSSHIALALKSKGVDSCLLLDVFHTFDSILESQFLCAGSNHYLHAVIDVIDVIYNSPDGPVPVGSSSSEGVPGQKVVGWMLLWPRSSLVGGQLVNLICSATSEPSTLHGSDHLRTTWQKLFLIITAFLFLNNVCWNNFIPSTQLKLSRDCANDIIT